MRTIKSLFLAIVALTVILVPTYFAIIKLAEYGSEWDREQLLRNDDKVVSVSFKNRTKIWLYEPTKEIVAVDDGVHHFRLGKVGYTETVQRYSHR